MPRKSHLSYSNMRAWKIVREGDTLTILPSLRTALLNTIVVLPGFALFWWLLHRVVPISDKSVLPLADAILFGTPLLMVTFAIVAWLRSRHEGLPYLKITKSLGLAELPRHDLRFHAGDRKYTFVHDHFIEKSGSMSSASEFNLVADIGENEVPTPLLKFLGYYKLFDRLGAELESCGFRFLQRTTHIDDKDS